MIIDFFRKLGEAFRDNILDFDPYNPELIMGQLIREKTQKARSLVDPSSYAYLKNLPLDAQYKNRLFEVLEAAFYMPYVEGPHKEERDGMIQAVKDAMVWAEEEGFLESFDDVRREIEMIESIPLGMVELDDKLLYIINHENFGKSPNAKAYTNVYSFMPLIGEKPEEEPDDDAPPPPTPEERKDPLILDLNRDGKVSTTPGKRYFDMDANGVAERVSWAGSGDGFLVMDRDGDGKITSGRELFGDHTVMSDSLDRKSVV